MKKSYFLLELKDNVITCNSEIYSLKVSMILVDVLEEIVKKIKEGVKDNLKLGDVDLDEKVSDSKAN